MTTDQYSNRKAIRSRLLSPGMLAGVMGVWLACAITACGRKDEQVTGYEETASKADRVAGITKLLGKSTPIPGPILDAYMDEEQTGDGRLGPSESRTFYALTVAPADLPAWKAALSKSKPSNTFSNDDEIKRASPTKARSWWVNGADLGKLEYFSPHSLTGSANGWVGIAPESGKIYVYVFTM